MNFSDKNIIICTDSQGALNLLSSPYINSKTAIECIRKLNEIGSINRICLTWVPGHSSFEGNKQADTLAKLGSNLHCSSTQNLPIQLDNAKSKSKNSKKLWPIIDEKLSKWLISQDRNSIGNFIKAITGQLGSMV